MPLFTYKCPKCEVTVEKLLKAEDSKLERRCEKDGEALVRAPRMGSAQIKEVIDNGLYARRVVTPKKNEGI